MSRGQFIFQMPVIIVTDTGGSEWEDDENVNAVVQVGDNRYPYNARYIDFWGDGGFSPQDVVDDIVGTLVELALTRLNRS